MRRTRSRRAEGDASPLASLPIPTRKPRKAAATAAPSVPKTKRARESSADQSVDSPAKRARLDPSTQKPSPAKSALLDTPAQKPSPAKRALLDTPTQKPSPKYLSFATERVVSPALAPAPSPALSQTPTQDSANAEASSHTNSHTPTQSFHSAQSTVVRNNVSHILEGDESTFTPDDESTPAQTYGLFGTDREASRPRPTPRRRILNSQTTPVNGRPSPSLPFTAPPVTNTTVAEDFAGLLPPQLTPRPYPIHYTMSQTRRPVSQSERKPAQEPTREKELFALSDEEDEDDEASIHEEEYPKATARQLRENNHLLREVNKSFIHHQTCLETYRAKGLGSSHMKTVRNRSGSQDKIIINIVKEVEKVCHSIFPFYCCTN